MQQEHNGTYVCVASNPAGTLDVEVHVIVLAPPKVGADEQIELKQDGHATLNCDVLNPDASTTYTWLFVNLHLFNPFCTLLQNNSLNLPAETNILSGAISTTGTGSGIRLHISKANFDSHAGTYTCLVRNSAGQAEKRFRLDILGKHQIKKKIN